MREEEMKELGYTAAAFAAAMAIVGIALFIICKMIEADPPLS